MEEVLMLGFVFACASLLVIQGSAEGIPVPVSNTNEFISNAPTPVPQPIEGGLQPPFTMPPLMSAPVPQTPKGPPSPTWPSPSTSPPSPMWPSPSTSPPNPPIPDPVPSLPPSPSGSPQHSEHPSVTAQDPAPAISPSTSSPPDKQSPPPASQSIPPISHKSEAPTAGSPPSTIAPASNVPAPRGMPNSPPPSHSTLPNEPAVPPPVSNVPAPRVMPNSPPPSHSTLPNEPAVPPPDVSAHPALPGNSPTVEPIPNEPPSSPPVQNATPLFAPPPSMSKKTNFMPVAAPTNRTIRHYAPVRHPPIEAPSSRNSLGHSHAPPPRPFSRSPKEHYHSKVYKITPSPLSHVVPSPSGSAASSLPVSSRNNSLSPVPAPSPPGQAKIPSSYPKISPSRPSRGSPKTPNRPPLQALPPPPPHKDCAPLTCAEPLAYGPPESPCVCVLPIQVGLRLSVALYTFFPLVSELAAEIAAGIFMKQSQVRIMGANADGDSTGKTIVLIDLLPLGVKFDDTTAYLTFQRFWRKQVVIKASVFGDYDVLYVRYPGLPPSPPLPPSTIGIIASKPYPGRDNNGRTMQPLGVDISRNQHKHRLSGSILATITLSCFVALFLLSAVAWILLYRHRQCAFQPDPTPTTTIRSLAKSSGIPVSIVGSGISSPSFSLGSSIAAYSGSAKTYSSSDIERATDCFNETRILGEGGFGLVYSGVLDDGTEVAIKVLKRCDQQSGREFMAEVEMLSRLHHRNLVKLIGICVEDRNHCLVYELITNGSVESHLHGIDKERSPLDWSARLKIALGAARALAYLHEDSSPHVIHRDFKASNILLEDDFTPKVSDFGLARAALDENTHISTRVMGTFGYVAPEYAMTGHLLVKSDVYSYGVVLLELLTGRKPVDMSQPAGEENLVSWARPLLTSRQGLESIIDQSVGPDIPFDSIAKVAAIASMCVQPEVSHRPFMGEVVQALKLICSECDEAASGGCGQEDMSIAMEGRGSTNSELVPAPMLSPSTLSDYDYRLDLERDVSMSSELLNSKTERQDCVSFRRYSSSGPLGRGKAKPLWKRLARGSVSEHGVLLRLWPRTQ